MTRGKVLMVQGSMSSVGKSLMVAALCRIFKQDGVRVAPFKAQNMALNSFATRDGREVGRAQAMQADAARVLVTVEMNPVLLKPEADAFAQIVVMGKPWARMAAGEYMTRRSELWNIVTNALDALRAEYELVVMEGAGSPAELNLRRGDLVNMSIAAYANAPVLLVGDIDRGGIFAQLIGTYSLLPANEQSRIQGYIVNKFRGDARLFDDGVTILQERSGVRVLGVVPYIHDLKIADEDSLVLENSSSKGVSPLRVAVMRLPHMSNFDDFDPLRAESDVVVDFVERAEDLVNPDLIILPGTKTTIADLKWLRARGLEACIQKLAHAGIPILGVCGGYQMLGRTILDPQQVESTEAVISGLALLPVVTTFEKEKRTEQVRAHFLFEHGLCAQTSNLEITAYEIHMGRTVLGGEARPLLQITQRGENAQEDADGAASGDGWILGTYLHGFLDDDTWRARFLENLRGGAGARGKLGARALTAMPNTIGLRRPYAEHLDMPRVYAIAGMT